MLFRKRILLGLRLLLPSTIIRFGRRQTFRVLLQKLFTLRRQVVLGQSLLICLRMSRLWKQTLSTTASCICRVTSRLLSLMNCRLRRLSNKSLRLKSRSFFREGVSVMPRQQRNWLRLRSVIRFQWSLAC